MSLTCLSSLKNSLTGWNNHSWHDSIPSVYIYCKLVFSAIKQTHLCFFHITDKELYFCSYMLMISSSPIKVSPFSHISLQIWPGSLQWIKDLGPLHYFLGIEVISYDGGIFLTQAKYAIELHTKTNVFHPKNVYTHFNVNTNLHLTKATEVDKTSYRSVVRALQYMTLMRLDTCCRLRVLIHYDVVKRIFPYRKRAWNYGLLVIT